MPAAIKEIQTAIRDHSGVRKAAGGDSVVALPSEQIQAITAAMEKTIENIVRQSQINAALVKRLLELEQKVTELTKTAGTVGRVGAILADHPQAHVAQDLLPQTSTRDALPMYMGDSTAMCRVLNSFRMYVDTRDTMCTPQLLLNGIWEPALTRLMMQSLKSGMTVVDIGANAGYYTLLAAAAVGEAGRVIAFEPEPRNLEILRRNMELNGVCDRVMVHGKAVLNERKTVEIYQNPSNLGAHTLFLADPNHSPFSRVKVETVALDDVIDKPVDFMKIDAEGSEPFIFKGMKKLFARSPQLKIMMEFNTVTLRNAGVEPAAFLASLGEMGFSVRVVTPQATLAPAVEQTVLSHQLSTLFLARS